MRCGSSPQTKVYFRKGVVANRPDHFKRFLRFKGFLNLAISDSVNDVMQNQDSSSLFEDKTKYTIPLWGCYRGSKDLG